MTCLHHQVCRPWLVIGRTRCGCWLCLAVACVVLSTPAIGFSGQLDAPAIGSNSPASTAVSAGTNAIEPVVPVEINIALRNSSNLIASSNLQDVTAKSTAARQLDFQAELEMGWRQKQDKDFSGAAKTFVGLLESDAPPEFQRTALLELALLAQETQQPARAQQVFTQYLQKYPDDPSAAEVLLRQGLLYREMGAPTLALSKFYSVMTTSLRLKLDRLEYYQRLVLQAQTEIADTYYLQGKFAEAADFLGRLLKLDNPQLNTAQILYKLVRSLSSLGRHTEVVAQSEMFISRFSGAGELAEVRFLLADSLKKLGRPREATQQVLALLESQQSEAGRTPENWVYWQQRAGNEIANQLYKEGDYVNALEIYRSLAALNRSATWQLPVWYQMGLVYEKLQQPQLASETYARILERQKELAGDKLTPSLAAVMDMAKWRKDHLEWQMRAVQSAARLRAPAPALNASLPVE
ncbi:MAG: tetratricopeptide repeat protein [Verrucomicrobia bacterium]|nr:tetratricopeptide repeat protein [Verrucomicrobiota bacterium]